MYLRWLFYFATVVQLAFGVGLLFVPEQVASAYGSSFDPTAIALARFLGAALLPLAWVSWAAASTGGSPLKLALARTYEFGGIADLIVTWLALQAGVMTATGATVNFVVAAIFTVGFGYYGWVKTEAALR